MYPPVMRDVHAQNRPPRGRRLSAAAVRLMPADRAAAALVAATADIHPVAAARRADGPGTRRGGGVRHQRRARAARRRYQCESASSHDGHRVRRHLPIHSQPALPRVVVRLHRGGAVGQYPVAVRAVGRAGAGARHGHRRPRGAISRGEVRRAVSGLQGPRAAVARTRAPPTQCVSVCARAGTSRLGVRTIDDVRGGRRGCDIDRRREPRDQDCVVGGGRGVPAARGRDRPWGARGRRRGRHAVCGSQRRSLRWPPADYRPATRAGMAGRSARASARGHTKRRRSRGRRGAAAAAAGGRVQASATSSALAIRACGRPPPAPKSPWPRSAVLARRPPDRAPPRTWCR